MPTQIQDVLDRIGGEKVGDPGADLLGAT